MKEEPAPPPRLPASRQTQLALVQMIHVVIILYILFTPFLANNVAALLLYMLFVIAIVMHWIANHHFCVLSMLESKIRGIEYEKGFINSILKPVFGFGVNNTAYYVIMALLFTVAIYRLVNIVRSHRCSRCCRRKRRRKSRRSKQEEERV